MEQNKINSNCGKNHSTTPPQSPSGDFVSADINEGNFRIFILIVCLFLYNCIFLVLRGARQILTGGKPLEEDPNNRVCITALNQFAYFFARNQNFPPLFTLSPLLTNFRTENSKSLVSLLCLTPPLLLNHY